MRWPEDVKKLPTRAIGEEIGEKANKSENGNPC
jgi:hypothetical protein